MLLNSIFHTSVIDSRSWEWKEAKTIVPIISQNVQSIWMEFGIPLRHVGLMNLIHFYLVHVVSRE